MNVLTLSTYTVHVPPRPAPAVVGRVRHAVREHRLQARQRRLLAAALSGDLGPGQRADVVAALARR